MESRYASDMKLVYMVKKVARPCIWAEVNPALRLLQVCGYGIRQMGV